MKQLKKVELGYAGMSQDLAKSKENNTKYFSAKDIRIISTDQQSSLAVTNEKGNELLFEIPAVTVLSLKTYIQFSDPFNTGIIKKYNY